MEKSIKRIVSAFLAVILVMLVPSFTFYAFASENEYAYTTIENGIKITRCPSDKSEIVIPETIDGYDVVEIDLYAFDNRQILEHVEFPTKAISGNYAGVARSAFSVAIGENTTVMKFSETSDDALLTDIYIDGEFSDIDILMKLRAYFGFIKNITVDENNPAFEVVDGVLYDGTVETLILYPSGSDMKEYVMPSTVKRYNDNLRYDRNSTYGALSLEKITLSRDFMSEDYDELYSSTFGYNANISEEYGDYGAKSYIAREIYEIFPRSLKSIDVDLENPYFSSYEGSLYDKEGSFLYYHPLNGSKNIVLPAEVSPVAFYSDAGFSEGMNVTLSNEFINTLYRFNKQLALSYKSSSLESEDFKKYLKNQKKLSDEEISNISDDDFLEYYCEFASEMIGEVYTGEDLLNSLLYNSLIAFLRTFSVVSYTVPESNEHLCSVDGAIYNKDKTVFVKYPLEGKSPIIEFPDTVKEFAVMDGIYMNFNSDVYPFYRDDLIVHVESEHLNELIDSENISLMCGVSYICVDKITEKFEKHNEELKNSLAEIIAKVEESISELKTSYENGEISDLEYKTSVRYYERQIKFPEIVECKYHSKNAEVICIPEEDCCDVDVTLKVTKDISNSEVLNQFKVHVSGNGSIKEVYNISLVDTDGNVVQPNEGKKVTVRIKIPDNTIPAEKYYVIHKSSTLDATEIIKNKDIRYENGYIVFEVDHFSYFAICIEDDSPAEKNVSSISIATLPSKTSYTYKKENLDLSGLALTVTYSDGTTETVTDTSKMKVTGFDNSKTGTQTVTVEYEGETASFDVAVSYAWWQWIIRILLLGFLWY